MSKDLLDWYEDTCRKAALWLNAPMSRRDFEPILELLSSGSAKVRFPMKLLKAGVASRTGQKASRVRRHLRATVTQVGSAAFRTATLRDFIARERVRCQAGPYANDPRTGSQRKLARLNRVFEMTLWLAIVGAMAYCSFTYTAPTVQQAQQHDLFNSQKNQTFLARTSLSTQDGKLLGFLDIPRIGVSSVVEEGSAPNILSRSLGHVPGTALPGERGSIGLAGHLDPDRQELSKLRVGDILTFRSSTRVFAYSVVSTSIVATTDARTSPSSNQSLLTVVNYLPISDPTKAATKLVIVARENLPIEPYLLR